MKPEHGDLATPTNKFSSGQLRTRVITGLILIAIALNCLYTFGEFEFELISALIWVIAAYEMAGLCGLSGFWRFMYVLLFCPLLYIGQILDSMFMQRVALGAWGIILIFMLIYPFLTDVFRRYSIRIPLSYAILLGGWLALVSLFQISPHWVLYLFGLVWATDIAAYFSGSLYGSRKFSPSISPGKTWMGVGSGIGAAFLVGLIAGVITEVPLQNWPKWLLLAIATSVAAVLGDLGMSLMKRISGFKDTGRILPGHGGLLDRLDSLLFAAPVLSLGWLML